MEIWDLLQKHNKGELSYTEGVTLFSLIKPESSLLFYLQTEDKSSRKKLKDLLDKKYQEYSEKNATTKFHDFGISKHRNNPVNLQLLTPELRTFYAERVPLIRERGHLHARLSNCSTDAQRYEIAKEIHALSIKIRAIFTRVDHFVDSGHDLKHEPALRPEPMNKEIEKNFVIQAELVLLRSRRSKAKNDPRKVELYNSLDKKIKELEALRNVQK